MAKPQIIVNAGDPGVKAAVSASTSWTATLDSTDGVRQVEWAVTSTDETTTAASYTLVTSGSVGQTVTSTSQGQGTALILWVRVNAGKVGDQPDPENTEATVKIYVPLADGGEVGCAGEEYESDPTFGSTGIINSGIRKAAALSPSGVPVKIVRAATSTALPANTRTNNILTASSNGAIGTVGGVAVVDGDHILVKDEGGVAAHVNDGPYVLADGDGSSPWTLTRATYFDASEELIPMTTFRIQEGTYAGKEFYLATSGATINVTALEFAAYAYAPNDAAYLCVGSSGFLSNEVNVSAIGTTVEFTSTSTVPFATKRTDSATAALVDVEQVTALSSGTAAAGFGPSTLYKGEVFGGGAENYGRIGFAATDLTNTSEDTKLVVQARTAGASLATCAEFSGTAVKLTALGGSGSGVVAVDNSGVLSFSAGGSGADSTAKYLTDASATVNANDVPIQALSSQLAFVGTALAPIKSTHKAASSGTVVEGLRVAQQIGSGSAGAGGEGVRIALSLPNASGIDTAAGTWRVQSTTVLGGVTANQVWATASAGTLTDRMTLSATGVLDVPAGLTAASLDASSAGALTLGGTNATSIAASSLKITGLANGTTGTDAAAFGQIGTAVNAAVSGTTNKVPKFTAAHVVGDSSITDDGTTVSTTEAFSVPGAGSSSERIGASTTAAGANSAALGNGAKADASGTIAIGQGTQLTGSSTDTIAIGRGITSTSANGVTIGAGASNYANGVTIGAGGASGGPSGVAIGYAAGSGIQQTVSIGRQASAGGQNNVAIGYNASATGSGGATESIAIGAASATGYTSCIAIGGGAACTAANQALIGGANTSITSVYIGKGVTHATPAAVTVQPTGGSTNGVTGAALTIAGGKGGAAADAGGAVSIQTAAAGTGTTLETRMSFAASGARTDSFPSSAIRRTEHGTSGTNYVDDTGLATGTLTQSATSTIYTVAVDDNTYVKVIVHGVALDVNTPTRSQQFARYGAIQRIGGTVALTSGGADLHAKIENGVWGSPVMIDFTDSGNNLLVRATTPALDIKVVVEKIEIFVASTTA